MKQMEAATAAHKTLLDELVILIDQAERQGKRVVGVKQVKRALIAHIQKVEQ